MLKISEMAKLAHTTRRTLIFYDQEALFTPNYKTAAGYRYYDYDQLYDLLFILGLRNLSISLEEIKKIKDQSTDVAISQLLGTQSKIDEKINELVRIKKVINKRLENQAVIADTSFYQPAIKDRPPKKFWCSRQSVGCTEEEVAQLFSEFYNQLDSLAVMDTNKSGFLTNLTVDQPADYDTASFRIIREVITDAANAPLPTIEKDAGKYACVLVENNSAGIHHGLTNLKTFCQANGLVTEKFLWQINASSTFVKTGSSKYGWLEFAILNA
ncbi:transcriptional regulator [Lactobacillus sp. CBA3605]|uniref:MerR family transcriptional regulator n=1 Tax=Lactobacillus sp. CBA3605 TaxID=2099788 RepID=UPI000CFC2439|nr:MerR family transcriptional regulator [Lactobacillus sp. CBA3605]AVK61762.1 transcriptional regulator [Lactobacillus sp. CBA3605]